MTSREIIAATLVMALSDCASTDLEHTRPHGPLDLRGIPMSHALTAADSVQLAQYGKVVAMIRRDSLIVLLSDADPLVLRALPGVGWSGPSLGNTVSAEVEILIGVGAVYSTYSDSAAKIMNGLGRVVGKMHDGEIDGMIPANRLGELDHYPAISSLYVGIDPARIAVRAP